MVADRVVRAALVVAAVSAVLRDASLPVTGTLVALAVTAVAQRAVAGRRRGALDAVLLGVGATLVTLVLTGFVLNGLGFSLTRTPWALALGAVGLVVLVVPTRSASTDRAPHPDVRAPEGPRPSRLARTITALKLLPWALACLAVTALAVSQSVSSTRATQLDPVAMSIATVDGVTAEVVVSSEQATGPLELRTDTAGTTLSYPLFRVAAGGSRTTDVLLSPTEATTITVSNPGQSAPLLTVTVKP